MQKTGEQRGDIKEDKEEWKEAKPGAKNDGDEGKTQHQEGEGGREEVPGKTQF